MINNPENYSNNIHIFTQYFYINISFFSFHSFYYITYPFFFPFFLSFFILSTHTSFRMCDIYFPNNYYHHSPFFFLHLKFSTLFLGNVIYHNFHFFIIILTFFLFIYLFIYYNFNLFLCVSTPSPMECTVYIFQKVKPEPISKFIKQHTLGYLI